MSNTLNKHLIEYLGLYMVAITKSSVEPLADNSKRGFPVWKRCTIYHLAEELLSSKLAFQITVYYRSIFYASSSYEKWEVPMRFLLLEGLGQLSTDKIEFIRSTGTSNWSITRLLTWQNSVVICRALIFLW